MKKSIVFISLFLFMSLVSIAQSKETTIKVSGNCGMCKAHIEKAAKQAGAMTASWDKVAKLLKVSFDAAKTSTDKIEDAIAKAGYDTEHKVGDSAAYAKLDDCCKYDRTAKKPN